MRFEYSGFFGFLVLVADVWAIVNIMGSGRRTGDKVLWTVIILLLRYERQLVSRSVGNWLLALRISVLAVILMTLLQPVLSWTLDQKRTGKI